MACYLLCFKRKEDDSKAMYKHAGHYLGYTDRASAQTPDDSVRLRLREHQLGYGSALTRAASAAGLKIMVSRIWPDGTLADEKRLRCRHENPRLCPHCNPGANNLA